MVACSVWNMLRLIDVAYGPNVITWGNVFWMDVNVDKHNYERENILFTFQTRGDKLRTYHIQAQISCMWMPQYGLRYHQWFCGIFG